MSSSNPIKDKNPSNIDINKKPEQQPVAQKDNENKKLQQRGEWQPMDQDFPGSSKGYGDSE